MTGRIDVIDLSAVVDLHVADTDASPILWTGTLERLWLDNPEIPAVEVLDLADGIKRDGRAFVGGGAAPLFLVTRRV